MSKPPPPPPSAAAKSQVEAFGQAFDAALSLADNVVVDGDGVPTRVEPSESEQVYANDLELRGVYTGPYSAVEDAPPTLGHLAGPAPRLKTLETAAVPGPHVSGASPVPVPAPAPRAAGGSNAAVMGVLALAVIGVGLAFAVKFGVL